MKTIIRAASFLACVLMTFLVCFYFSSQVFTSSIQAVVPRPSKTVMCSQSICSIDDCFDLFMKLLKGCQANREYCFNEPNPPISIANVSKACRHHLIPGPAPVSLSQKTIRCYSRRRVNSKTRTRVRQGLSVVKKLFDENGIPLVVDSGSYLGSLRYHGIIPYDDDFDFRIPSNLAEKAKTVLAKLCNDDARFRCDLTLRKMDHYQVHIGVTKHKHSASFIDFFFYSVRGDHIFWPDLRRIYRKDIVFPTVKRPLEGQLFDCPRDPKAYQSIHFKNYAPTECHAYDHHYKQRKGCRRVPCSHLNSFLPFLVAAEKNGSRLELVIEKACVKSIFLHRNRNRLP